MIKGKNKAKEDRKHEEILNTFRFKCNDEALLLIEKLTK